MYCKKNPHWQNGGLNIGYTSSFLNIIPEIVNAFNRQYPDINLKLTEMSSVQQEQALLKGHIDLGFMRKSENDSLTGIALGNDYLCVVTHPNIGNRKINMDELLNANNLILLCETSNPELYHIVSDYLREHSLNMKPAQHLTNVYSVLALVGSGMGISVLPYSIISFLRTGFNCQALSGSHSEWLLGMVWNKDLELPLRTEFINCVTENNHNKLSR